MQKKFNLEIHTTERVFFKGEVESLILNTETGEMGVMSDTLPIVSILSPGVMSIVQDGKRMEAVGSGGIVNIARNVVTILLDSALWPHEIDVSKVQEEIDELGNEERKTRSYAEYKMAKAQLAMQFAKLKLKKRDR